VISDIESLVKSVAILCGILGGFWTWLVYMRRRLIGASADLDQRVRHWIDNEKTTLHVVLQVHNVGNVTITGEANTEIEELPAVPRQSANAEIADADRPENGRRQSCTVAPNELAEFYFDISIAPQSQARRFRISSSVTAREPRWWRTRSSRTWNVQTIHEI
jgi:hypothetical protein